MTEQPAEQQDEVVEPVFSEDREQEMRDLDEHTELVPDDDDEGGGNS